MVTEFQQLIETCKRSGIHFHIHWSPASEGTESTEHKRKLLQGFLKEAGFNLTALSTNAVIIGDVYYVYSCGKPHWTTYEDDETDMSGHKGWGEDDMFLFSWNKKTGDRVQRVLMDKDNCNAIAFGRKAVELVCGPFPKFTSRG